MAQMPLRELWHQHFECKNEVRSAYLSTKYADAMGSDKNPLSSSLRTMFLQAQETCKTEHRPWHETITANQNIEFKEA